MFEHKIVITSSSLASIPIFWGRSPVYYTFSSKLEVHKLIKKILP